jgi:PadR family transcriptional regulator, regulatory protein PadR
MTEDDELELLRGTVDLLVLRALAWGPRHGYAIAKWIRWASRDELGVEDRALYIALHRLEARKLIRGRWEQTPGGRRTRTYELTPAGNARLTAAVSRWERYVRAMRHVLSATPAEEGG